MHHNLMNKIEIEAFKSIIQCGGPNNSAILRNHFPQERWSSTHNLKIFWKTRKALGSGGTNNSATLTNILSQELGKELLYHVKQWFLMKSTPNELFKIEIQSEWPINSATLENSFLPRK